MSRLIYQRYWLQVIAIGLIGSIALYLYGVPYGVDLPHHYRLAQGFFESIKGGDLYLSWLSSTNDGYGDPSVRFYPPALYYILSVFRLITGDWYIASLLALSLLTGLLSWHGGRRPRLAYGLALLVFLSAGVMMSACGAGSSGVGGNQGSPAGTYPLVVSGTFTSGSTKLTHNANLTLVVQ